MSYDMFRTKSYWARTFRVQENNTQNLLHCYMIPLLFKLEIGPYDRIFSILRSQNKKEYLASKNICIPPVVLVLNHKIPKKRLINKLISSWVQLKYLIQSMMQYTTMKFPGNFKKQEVQCNLTRTRMNEDIKISPQ